MAVIALALVAHGWPDCACIDACHAEGLADFFSALPVAASRASPWWPMIRRAYHDGVRPPQDLRRFGYFDLPHARARPGEAPIATWRPALHHCGAVDTPPQLSVACAREACARAGWLANPAPPRLRLGPSVACRERHKRRRLVGDHRDNCTLRPWSWRWEPERLRAAFGTTVPVECLPVGNDTVLFVRTWAFPHTDGRLAFARFGPEHLRRGVGNNAWVEVLRRGFPRRSRYMPEGVDQYGCWFHLLLAPYDRGSGLFVNVGRTLVLPDRRAVAEWYRHGGNLTLDPRRGDRKWGGKLAGEGYDSMQVLKGNWNLPELLVVREPCLNQTQPVGACLPRGVEVRTGAHASRPCACAEYGPDGMPTLDYDNRVGGPLNCDYEGDWEA